MLRIVSLALLVVVTSAGPPIGYGAHIGYGAPAYATAVAPYAAHAVHAAPVFAQAVHAAPIVAKVPVRAEPYDPHPQYNFGYAVHDSLTGDHHSHSESRDGDVVKGQYSLVEPDGSIRTVTYTADAINGFNAVVNRQPPTAVVKQPIAVAAPVHHVAPAFQTVHAAPVHHVAPAFQSVHAAPIHHAPVHHQFQAPAHAIHAVSAGHPSITAVHAQRGGYY